MNSKQELHLKLLGFQEIKHSKHPDFILMCDPGYASRCVRINHDTSHAWNVYEEDDTTYRATHALTEVLNKLREADE